MALSNPYDYPSGGNRNKIAESIVANFYDGERLVRQMTLIPDSEPDPRLAGRKVWILGALVFNRMELRLGGTLNNEGAPRLDEVEIIGKKEMVRKRVR